MQGIGDTRLVAIVSSAANGHTKISISGSTLFVTGSLNGQRVISARNLQHSHTSFVTIDQKVSSRFIVLQT
jgi:hypothetical protein